MIFSLRNLFKKRRANEQVNMLLEMLKMQKKIINISREYRLKLNLQNVIAQVFLWHQFAFASTGVYPIMVGLVAAQ